MDCETSLPSFAAHQAAQYRLNGATSGANCFAGRNSSGLIAAHGRSRADNPEVGCPEDIVSMVLVVASDEIAMGNRASDDLDGGRSRGVRISRP
jgi:hypothetical protein